MELFGIHWAPLNVPLQRRLQTLAAGCWFVIMAFGGFMMWILTAYLIFFTSYWWLTLIYILWIKTLDKDTCEEGGRKSEWVRSWTWWRYFRDYFPVKLERVSFMDLDPKRNYLFCCFPHGMLCTGPFVAFGTNYGGFKEFFPNHKRMIMTLGQHFDAPFFREMVFGLGGCKASAKSIEHVLDEPHGGNIGILMVGGATEAFYCRPGQYKIILNKRKGFIKCALKSGSPLVPVFSFGETDVFDQVDNPEGSWVRSLQEWLKNYIGIAPAIPVGRGFFQYNFGLVPRRRPVTTVVGRPMEIPKIQNPTPEQVDEIHAKFKQCLIDLFEEQKRTYLKDAENVKLEIL
ncbi:2-acylglycerol O-acyltransferase 1-like isoform X2 [Atheta coriaria]